VGIDSLDIEFCCAILKEEAVEFLTEDRVHPEHLREDGKRIFEFLRSYYSQYGSLPTLTTIHAELNLVDGATAAYYDDLDPLDYYSDTIRQREYCRVIGQWKKQVEKKIQKGRGFEAKDLIAELHQRLIEMEAMVGNEAALADYAETAPERWEDYKAVEKIKGGVIGLRFPWNIMTEQTQGIQPGNLIIIIGSLGTGKTWILTLIVSNLFYQFLPGYDTTDEDSRVVTLYVTMEMTRKEIEKRLDSILVGQSFSALKRGQLPGTDDPAEGGRALYKEFLLEDLIVCKDRLFIADAGCVRTVTDIEVLISRLKPDVVVVDGFYKLTTHGPRDRKIWERVTDVSDQLKKLGVRKGIPIIATTQYNREVARKAEKHKHKAGSAAGAGFSYAIFQDADIGIGIYADDETHNDGEIFVYLVKNRNDPGELAFRAEWDMENMSFEFIDLIQMGEAASKVKVGDFDSDGTPDFD
jgi:replicative DNA helicase